MVTISTALTDDVGIKRGHLNEWTQSRVKLFVAKVTFGAAEDYATNGVAASLKQGKISSYIFVKPIDNDAGVLVLYDETNEKIKMYGSDPAAGGGAVTSLPELANTSQAARNKIFRFLVCGI